MPVCRKAYRSGVLVMFEDGGALLKRALERAGPDSPFVRYHALWSRDVKPPLALELECKREMHRLSARGISGEPRGLSEY